MYIIKNTNLLPLKANIQISFHFNGFIDVFLTRSTAISLNLSIHVSASLFKRYCPETLLKKDTPLKTYSKLHIIV